MNEESKYGEGYEPSDWFRLRYSYIHRSIRAVNDALLY